MPTLSGCTATCPEPPTGIVSADDAENLSQLFQALAHPVRVQIVTALIEAGFETLVNAGYRPEIAYFEVLHELKLIVDLIQAGGMMHMWDSVSNTAEYGGLTRRDMVINDESKKAMKKILDDINSGKFAEEWTKEWTVDLKNMKKLEAEESNKEIEKVGKEIRSLFERK